MPGDKTDLPIEHFPAFEAASCLKDWLPKGEPLRILDVGCGDGVLGHFLLGDGCVVQGIDHNEQLVDLAIGRGVIASQADWFEHEPEKTYDLIVFSRALHHMKPLDAALRKAHSCLKPNGRIFIDDFAFAEVSENTARWFHSFLESLEDQKQSIAESESFASEILKTDGDIAVWKKDYVRKFNTAEEIREVCEYFFELEEAVKVPYLYRYLCQALRGTGSDLPIAEAALKIEFELGLSGEIELIGRRYFGRMMA